MAIRKYKPTTPGRRGSSVADFAEITRSTPEKSLLRPLSKTGGRNNQGRITTRHRGGGARRFIRLVNFNLAPGTEAKVEHIEYDPGRSARIARIVEANGTYHYVLAGNDFKVGQTIRSGEDAPVESGNRLPLERIPVGSTIYAIELQPGRGAQIVRSAGGSAQLMAKEGGYAQVKLPSGEIRKVLVSCMATLGVVGNIQHQNVKIGKAGRTRRKGIRPTVRGVVMNAVDHPHGGGDGGRHGVGGGKNHGAAPRTPWGVKTLGYKTRRRKNTSKFIVKSRHAAKRK